jgi:hypothetical protein
MTIPHMNFHFGVGFLTHGPIRLYMYRALYLFMSSVVFSSRVSRALEVLYDVISWDDLW